jgi:hypothetical protein
VGEARSDRLVAHEADSLPVRSFAIRLGPDPGSLRVWTSRWGNTSRTGARTSPPMTFRLIGGGEYRTSPRCDDARATTVAVDVLRTRVVIKTGVGGIPPVYLYRSSAATFVVSELRLLPSLLRTEDCLSIDKTSAWETLLIGYPLDGRTMFAGVRLLRPCATFEISASSVLESRIEGKGPLADLSQNRFDRADGTGVVAAFLAALQDIPSADSVLSLSGGIDSRTILAGLLLLERRPALATCAGNTLSADAASASEIATAYALEHHVVTVGSQFVGQLAALAQQASILSGGFRSLEYAQLAYLQNVLSSQYQFRISGNGGNQLCRYGLEAVGYRNADLSILGPALAVGQRVAMESHWLTARLSESGPDSRMFLLNSELPWALGGGGILSSAAIVEMCPYLVPEVVRAAGGADPATSRQPRFTPTRARFRDLRHRVVGPNRSTSWQRLLICDAGGPIAAIPANWGWRPSGGFSLAGLRRGLLAALEAKLTAGRRGNRGAAALSRWIGANGTHEKADFVSLLATELRDFTLDTLASASVREAQILNAQVLSKVTRGFFGQAQTEHYGTIVCALDLALAYKNFCGKDARNTSAGSLASLEDGLAGARTPQ